MSALHAAMAVDGGIVAGPPPSTAEMFDALEQVNPFTPTQLVVSDQLWAIVGPEYERLASSVKSGNRHERREAWKRWRAFVAHARRSFAAPETTAPESA